MKMKDPNRNSQTSPEMAIAAVALLLMILTTLISANGLGLLSK